MTTTIQVRKKGQMTIPYKIREEVGVEEDDFLTLIPLGKKGFFATRKKLEIPGILKKSAEKAKKTGITLEELLAELDEIRHHS